MNVAIQLVKRALAVVAIAPVRIVIHPPEGVGLAGAFQFICCRINVSEAS